MHNDHAEAAPETAPGLDPPTTAPPLYAQDGQGMNAIVHAHYFVGGCDWLVTEYDPAERLVFGWACLNDDRQNAELGYASLAELSEVRVPLVIQDGGTGETIGIGQSFVERDEHWPEGLTIEQAIAELDRRLGR